MSSLEPLRDIDPDQLFRLFVDGRFQQRYRGWVGYEDKEPGSVSAMLEGLRYTVQNFDLTHGFSAHYVVALHGKCMSNVRTRNPKTKAGELRYLNAGMPLFPKSATLAGIRELLRDRCGDGTVVFNTDSIAERAEDLDAESVYRELKSTGRINYRPWYPEIDDDTKAALDGSGSLTDFVAAKHHVQSAIAERLDTVVAKFNQAIRRSGTDYCRLQAISSLVRDLEVLHPFADGNCRTFACALLTHLLLYWDFLPALLENPNLDGERSCAEFTAEIVAGMERTAQLIRDPSIALFGYSITESTPEERAQFRELAAPLLHALSGNGDGPVSGADEQLILTLPLVETVTGERWEKTLQDEPFKGVGAYGTAAPGYLYFCFHDEWVAKGLLVEDELRKVVERGVSAIVTSDAQHIRMVDVPVLVVGDVQKAFVDVARAVRLGSRCQLALVTGTVGKTSFKNWLYHCLSPQTAVHAQLHSGNMRFSILQSLSSIRRGDKCSVVEMAVGSPGPAAVERSLQVSPDVCVITHIGECHMHNHKSLDVVARAKASIVQGLRSNGVCVVNRDAELFDVAVSEIRSRRPDVVIRTFGTRETDYGCLLDSQFNDDTLGWDVAARIGKKDLKYSVPQLCDHAPLQSVGVLVAADSLGMDVYAAANDYGRPIEGYHSMGRVYRVRQAERTFLFYDQSYRGAIQGMRSAFQDLRRLSVAGKLVCVLGGTSVRVDNEYTKKQHREIGEMVQSSGCDVLLTYGPYMNYARDASGNHTRECEHIEKPDVLLDRIESCLSDGDLLFMMGAGTLGLGDISEQLRADGVVERLG